MEVIKLTLILLAIAAIGNCQPMHTAGGMASKYNRHLLVIT